MNEDPKDALMKKYQAEIEELRRLLEEGSGVDTSSGDDDEEDDDADQDKNGEKTSQYLGLICLQTIGHFCSKRDFNCLFTSATFSNCQFS